MGGEKTCDAKAAIVFIVGLVAGTGCIIAAKVLFELQSVGEDGTLQPFKPPVFETWVMFFGMLFALPTYLLTEMRRRHQAKTDRVLREKMASEPPVTFKMLMMLGVPAVFDLSSVLLMMIGLMEINSSMWMLLRGGGIVFVALMKQYALGDQLSGSMWVGVATISLAVVLVGIAGFVDSRNANSLSGNVPYGVAMTIAGTFMQSLQYVYEEKVMSGDTGAPPWLLIGMEGMFGTLLCTIVVYPIAGVAPGPDHGVYEDLPNTLAMLRNNPELLKLSVIFCVLVFILNSFSVLVTFMLSSVWHAILDNFRPITIWLVELCMFYLLTNGEHGEPWTNGSFLQLAGLLVMLLGTAIYNGSVRVPGLANENLLQTASKMASPALARSPLITRTPIEEPFAGSTSPYASKRPELPIANDLKQSLLVGRGR